MRFRVNDSPLRLAMRDLQQVFSRPSPWVILGAVIVAAGLSGPFGTLHSLGFGARLVYWAVIGLVTLFSGWLFSQWTVIALMRRGAARIVQWLVGSAVVAVIVALEVGVVNLVAFGISPLSPGEIGDLLLSTTPIALLITAAFSLGYGGSDAPPATVAPPVAGTQAGPLPRLLARLPLDKRGALLSLSVQDHYVDVVTTRGHEMLLMRLSDAIAETEGCAGLQVHRSHWVALDQVRAARREGARGVLTLSDGREIPVSRTYLPDAKKAGLL